MKHTHSMRFGAQCESDAARFRLWAPAAKRVDVQLDNGSSSRTLRLRELGDGWQESVAGGAAAGSRYRFRLDDALDIPDPASRFQPDDVFGSGELIAPEAWDWQDDDWCGRRWEEAVIYELHVGAFTPAGTFRGVIDKLDYLHELGVTALELMPVSDFPGRWNWGYDGVLPFAPDSRYGRPEDLKALVQAAHARRLMVFLDVVYNHFGPEGNFLHLYAPQFFSQRHHTPWGAAINFDGDGNRVVRDFFIANALYWLTEYRFDGLRIDAAHAIFDDSPQHILAELARAVRDGPGRTREIHLMLENDRNEARHLARADDGKPRTYTAQWNDDWHHALHVLLTGERHGYYADYVENAEALLARCLAEGFAYQGQASAFRNGRRRGEASRHLPPGAFISFLQNHDQIGNRALGERIASLTEPAALAAATTLLLLAPQPPLLFMGQEWGARQPFCFFCDFGPELADQVRSGRRREFARFAPSSFEAVRMPDPNSETTFRAAVLDWEAPHAPGGAHWRELHRRLLRLRHEQIVPWLARPAAARATLLQPQGLQVEWNFADGPQLLLIANLHRDASNCGALPRGQPLAGTPEGIADALAQGVLPAWGVAWMWIEH